MKLLKIIGFLSIIFLCTGCPVTTNVSVSENKKEYDTNLLGYWIWNDSIYHFFKNVNGELALTIYTDGRSNEDKEKQGEKVIDSKEDWGIFTTKIKSYNFFSLVSNNSKNAHIPLEYNFKSNEFLNVNYINGDIGYELSILSNDSSKKFLIDSDEIESEAEYHYKNSKKLREHLTFLIENFGINKVFYKYNNDVVFERVSKNKISSIFELRINL